MGLCAHFPPHPCIFLARPVEGFDSEIVHQREPTFGEDFITDDAINNPKIRPRCYNQYGQSRQVIEPPPATHRFRVNFFFFP